MILSDFILHSRVNQHWQYSGIDSLELCFNKEHFRSYPHPVDYMYNSRGFRDSEWPESVEELKRAIWCVGDSFTVGLGSPYNFTWPQVLSAATGRRCINISMDGASNAWISRRAQQIIKEIAPARMVVLWSYAHRREHSNIEWSDEARRIHSARLSSDAEDLANFVNCYIQLNTAATSTDIFNGAIPDFWAKVDMSFWKDIRDPSWPVNCPRSRSEFATLPKYVQQELLSQPDFKNMFELIFAHNKSTDQYQLIKLANLDYARDYHHFDIITSKFFVDAICKTLFSSNQRS